MLLNKRTVLWLAASVALCGFLALSSVAAPPEGKGKPGGGGEDPPPLPDIAYELTFLPIIHVSKVEDINDNLQVAGWYSLPNGESYDHVGFVYDHASGVVLTLADLISGEDLASLWDAGWTHSQFREMNDEGLIVGYLRNAGDTARTGIIIDTSKLETFLLTPYLGSEKAYLFAVNNGGDVVGRHYDGDVWRNFVGTYDPANNELVGVRDLGGGFQPGHSGQITDSRLLMLVNGYETFEYDFVADSIRQVSNEADGLALWDVDSFGRYVGELDVIRKRKVQQFPIVFDPASSDGIIWVAAKEGWAKAINDPSSMDLADGITLGDVVYDERTRSNERHPLYLYNPVWGELKIDDLIHPDDPDRDRWLQTTRGNTALMTQKRLDTNFGAIAGTAFQSTYILVPESFNRQ